LSSNVSEELMHMQRTLIGLNSGRINTREGILSRVETRRLNGVVNPIGDAPASLGVAFARAG
jgi:hypothetical protein